MFAVCICCVFVCSVLEQCCCSGRMGIQVTHLLERHNNYSLNWLQERALSALRKLLVVEYTDFVPPAAVEAADAEGVPTILRT